jgi:hypothetical protein
MTFRGTGDSTSRFSDLDWTDVKADIPEWTIPCQTLADFVLRENIQDLRLIKIDTEGAELFLFPSLTGWLGSLPQPKPSIWLSVHPPYWNKDTQEAARRDFWNAMSIYKHVYEERSNILVPVDINKDNWDKLRSDFGTYLLTDDEDFVYANMA